MKSDFVVVSKALNLNIPTLTSLTCNILESKLTQFFSDRKEDYHFVIFGTITLKYQ